MLDWLKATRRVFALFLGVFALSAAAQAGPEDGRIVNGSGSISQSGTHTDIRQNSDFLATHWGSFNIAAHESVQAHQPDASSRLLIRVDGGGATNIAGNYTSNGITILENRNGVQFSRGAIVNVGGLLATSSRISGVSGANWQLNGTGGAVVNHGQIAAGAGGVVLAAVRVENHGKITAQGGDVALGAGSAFTVDFAGSMVGFEVKKAADGASVVHDGVIESQGGIVSLSAQEAQAVRTNVVSVGGVVKATRLERRGGVVYLSGGTQGIAEVSGDVSASRKVQTTGEYVVVKGGALLKAPEILVGGDFQGKGDVPTARRTLVERGALLDAGAEGRVIVWSDETTWFNGDISAPGGFAEVSGKEVLASVNLAGIDVGELLLDPNNIAIVADSIPGSVAVTGNILAGDAPPTVSLAVGSINGFTGALSIAASNTITTFIAINKPMGDLSLIAGGNLTVGANIDNGTNTLTLTAGFESGTGDLVACPACTLTASTVSLTQDSAFGSSAPFMFAAGTLNLNTQADQDYRGWMAATDRNLSIDATGFVITIGVAEIDLGAGNLTLSARLHDYTHASGLTIRVGDFSHSGTFQTADLVSISTPLLVFADGNITLDTAFGLSNRLELRADADGDGMGMITSTLSSLGAGSVLLQQAGAFGATSLFSSATVPGAATFRITGMGVDQVIHPWMAGLGSGDFSLRGLEGEGARAAVVLNSITLPAALTYTGDIDLQAAAIALTVDTALTGGAISLTGAIDVPADNADDIDITITATGGAITINDNISLSTSTSGGGTITLVSSGSGSGINLGAVALTGFDIVLNGVIAASANNDLTLTASSFLSLNSDIDRGTGDLTLALGEETLRARFTGVRMLSGNVVTIGGTLGLETDGDLTISAGGNLMVNTNISLGSGATTTLRLEAGRGTAQTGNITFGDTALILQASNYILVQDGAVFPAARPADFRDETGTANSILLTGNPREIRITYDGATPADQAEVAWAAILLNTVSRGPGGTGDFEVAAADFVNGVLAAAVSITLDAGTGVLTFAATGDITLRAPAITITAGMIDLGADRTLTLTAESGTLTLNFTAATTITGTGTAGLTVIAEDIAFSGTAPILNVLEVSLELTDEDSSFPAAAPFAAASMIGTLNITTATLRGELLEYHGWMAATNRNLTITTPAGINIGSTAINLGTGNLTLNGQAGVLLTNVAGLTITAGDVTFSGLTLTDRTGAEIAHFVVVASGDIAISSNINLPASRIELRADADGMDGGMITTSATRGVLLASSLFLQQAGDFADNLFLSTSSAVSGAVTLRVTGAGVDQPIHPWMTNLGGTSFSLRGEGAVLDSITTAAAADFGTGRINLRATAITLGGDLTAGAVALRTNTITGDSANLVAIHATAGDITAITITSTGGAGTGRPTLTTSATSLSLEQTSAFGGRGTLPFIFADAVISTAITLSTRSEQIVRGWMIRENTNLTITSSDRVLVDTAIGSTVPNRSLGAGSLSLTSTGAAVRIFADISTTGNLTLNGSTGINFNNRAAKTLSGAAIMLTGNALSNRDLTITATSGALTINGDITATASDLVLTGGTGGIDLSGGARTISGVDITFTGVAASDANLTINASSALTLNNNITLTGSGLTLALRGAGAISNGGRVGANRPALTASTVSFRQDAAFATTGPFRFGAATGSLEFTTTARQDVYNWMIRENTNLTVTGSNRVRVLAAIGAGARNLGGGSLTLTSTGGDVRIVADISTTGDVTLTASGILTISSDINIGTNALTLTSGGAISNGGRVGANRPALTASTVSFRQDAAFATTGPFRFGAATGSLEFTTTARQDVHNWMIRENTNLTVTGSNRVRVLAAIGAGARNLGGGSLILTSTGGDVRIVADISTTGDVTLDASGILTISSDIDIGTNALTLTSGGAISNGGAADRPLLTASTVSFRQDAAFAAARSFGLIASSLEFTTTMNQDVHNWMIRENTNLTVTSSDRVRVLAAIGSGVDGRNLGTGSLTLTSTGRIVRIVADISTTGDATITASSILTINNDINIGTGALTLTGASFAIDTSVDLAAGSHSFTPDFSCTGSTTPSCTVNAP